MSPDEVAAQRAKTRPVDLESAAVSLYALNPDEFIATRNARAKTVSKSDKALGQQIRRLPKPSSAAWLINMLVRHRREDLDEVIELGVPLRQAQEDLDQQELKALGQQRNRVLAYATREAGSLAEELEHPVSEAVLTDVEQTLRAAMTDADAADAVASGLLLRVLEASGWEPVDLAGAVAVPAVLDGGARLAEKPTESGRRETKRRDAERTSDDDTADDTADSGTRQHHKTSRPSPREKPQEKDHPSEPHARARPTAAARKAEREEQRETRRRERQAQTKAAAELEQAERRARKAETGAERAANQLEDIADRREQLTSELDELRARLRELEGEVADIKQEEDDAEAAHRSADRAAEQARTDVEQARKQVERLS